MTKTAPRRLPAAGVWIDHRHARIVGLTPTGPAMATIVSHVEKHGQRTGDSPMKGPYEALQKPADDSRQRALTGELNIYYDAVIASLREYGALLMFGPGEAKGELHARLVKTRPGSHHVAIATADELTERQIIAKVRAHFGVAAPRLQPPQ